MSSVIPDPPRSRSDFHVAIICPLGCEANAVLEVFDLDWNDEGHRYGTAPGDTNSYTTGTIGRHNVVLVHMSQIGLVSASAAANNLHHSFPQISLTLLVGICGAVPHAPHYPKDIYLGDLIISTGIVKYDFGRQYPTGFEPKDTSEAGRGQLHERVRSVIGKLKTDYHSQRIEKKLSRSLWEKSSGGIGAPYPGCGADFLYQPEYLHRHRVVGNDIGCNTCSSDTESSCSEAKSSTCDELQCDVARTIKRPHSHTYQSKLEVSTHSPRVHFGNYASGNTVMKSGQHRDLISARDGIIAFEMEAAGIWDFSPCIIIRGVCDYADSHKNKDWQKYAAKVAAVGTRTFLQEWESLHTCALENAVQIPSDCQKVVSRSKWLLPFARDPNYVKRVGIIEQLDDMFIDSNGSTRAVLSGLGGVGKSQIAIEYAYHVRERFPDISIFWIHASTEDRFRASFQAIARELKLPGYQDPRSNKMDLVYNWFLGSDSGTWLLILDNLDELGYLTPQTIHLKTGFTIARYLPQRSNGSILATSRNNQVASSLATSPSHCIEIKLMSETEALNLARSKIPSRPGDISDLNLLCRNLEYLPLAITQAASYINCRQTMTVKRFVQILSGHESDSIRMLSEQRVDLRRDWDVPHSVISTWNISMNQIKTQNALAADILALMSAFDRQAVPNYLLQGKSSDYDFEQAIETLLSFAFISLEQDVAMSFSTHRLIQLATRSWLEQTSSWFIWHEKALGLLAREYPEPEYGNWVKCQLLEPHVAHVMQTTCKTNRAFLDTAKLLEKRALYHSERDCFEMAENCARTSFQERSRILGLQNPKTIESAHVLAIVLSCRGDNKAAEQILQCNFGYVQGLEQQNAGRYAACTGNLANLMISRGHSTYAIELCREALRVLSRPHPSVTTIHVLRIKSRMVYALYEAGLMIEAECQCRDTLAGQQTMLGMEHPDTLYTICSLVRILTIQGQYVEAEALAWQNLASRQKVLGYEHRKTYYSMDDLARLLTILGRYEEAEPLSRLCISGLEKILGPDHPHLLGKRLCLIRILLGRGAYVEARQLQRQVIISFDPSVNHGMSFTPSYRRELTQLNAEIESVSAQDYGRTWSWTA